MPTPSSYQRLVELILARADSERDNPSADGDGQLQEFDPDADAAELFYPHFYLDGPDSGAWVQSPNSWPGGPRVLSPEEDLTTTELYGVVDTAIAQLDADGAQLLALVDMDGLDSSVAAQRLGLEESVARRVLGAARNHVRAALDDYLKNSQP